MEYRFFFWPRNPMIHTKTINPKSSSSYSRINNKKLMREQTGVNTSMINYSNYGLNKDHIQNPNKCKSFIKPKVYNKTKRISKKNNFRNKTKNDTDNFSIEKTKNRAIRLFHKSIFRYLFYQIFNKFNILNSTQTQAQRLIRWYSLFNNYQQGKIITTTELFKNASNLAIFHIYLKYSRISLQDIHQIFCNYPNNPQWIKICNRLQSPYLKKQLMIKTQEIFNAITNTQVSNANQILIRNPAYINCQLSEGWNSFCAKIKQIQEKVQPKKELFQKSYQIQNTEFNIQHQNENNKLKIQKEINSSDLVLIKTTSKNTSNQHKNEQLNSNSIHQINSTAMFTIQGYKTSSLSPGKMIYVQACKTSQVNQLSIFFEQNQLDNISYSCERNQQFVQLENNPYFNDEDWNQSCKLQSFQGSYQHFFSPMDTSKIQSQSHYQPQILEEQKHKTT